MSDRAAIVARDRGPRTGPDRPTRAGGLDRRSVPALPRRHVALVLTWHPAVVEELWWLRGAHQDAYNGRRASWRDVGD